MDRILITGSSGFVGSNLKPYLTDKGYQVSGISRSPAGSEDLSYKQLNKANIAGSKAIIHLAGLAHDVKNTSLESDYYDVNTRLTETVFLQFLESDCPIFIYLSSVKAVADSLDELVTEHTVPRPQAAYGKSKLAAENAILSRTLPEGKRLYILRPCMIHGPGNRGNLNLLYSVVKKGIPYPLGKFDNRRSFLSVENLCFALWRLMKERPASGIYHIADDGALSTTSLVRIISGSLNKKPKIWHVPKWLVRFGASVGTLFSLPFNSERLHKLTENYVVDNLKLKKALNTEFPLGLEEGIKQTLKSFK